MNAGHQSRATTGAAGPVLRRWRGACVLAAAAAVLAGCAGTAQPPAGAPPTGMELLMGAAPGAVTQNAAAAFTAGVGLTRPAPLRVGEAVGFVLTSSTAGYGSLYLINTSGSVVALAENLAVASDAPVLFPAPDAGFSIRANPPAGVNRVLLLVTAQPFAGLGGVAGGAPVTLGERADAFVARLNAATAGLAANAWALAEVRVEVVAGG